MSEFLDDLWSRMERVPEERVPSPASPASNGSPASEAPPADQCGNALQQGKPGKPASGQQPGKNSAQADGGQTGNAPRVTEPASKPEPVEAAKLATGSPPPPVPLSPASVGLTQPPETQEAFLYPKPPRSLEQIGFSAEFISRLIMKLLASRGAVTGRRIAAHLRIGFSLIEPILLGLRREQLLDLKGDAGAGDYTYVITPKGLDLASKLARECTYFGAVPVTLSQYIDGMRQQSITNQCVRAADLNRAFSDLLLDEKILSLLGPAINAGRGLFLFGEPGNGKTSIAERISRSFGSTLWIPRAIAIDGQLIRVFDPSLHREASGQPGDGTPDDPMRIDQRWVRIHRPTVVAGGELTMEELEVTQDRTTHVCEAPLQLKSNGGVLLIDDFGRQRMPVDELLNRWIVPLEKRYDLLNLPSGKKIQVPFEQLVIFSTNLEPKDLVDDAFLRRIPYKVHVPNPTPAQFHELFRIECRKSGVACDDEAVDYLIQTHYVEAGRQLRACHPRDLLQQVKNHCLYEERQFRLTQESLNFAVAAYFSVLS